MLDFAIVGGGASGLALAHALLEQSLGSIAVIERDEDEIERRTLSYWADRAVPFDGLVERTWSRLLFAAPGFARELELGGYRYATVRGAALKRHVRDALAASPRTEWVPGHASRIDDASDHAEVIVDGRTIRARWVFDSRLEPQPDVLHQLFVGWEIETELDAFDPARATLFDFRTEPAGDMRFFYVLPFTARRALVELVRLAPGDHAASTIERYLGDVLGLGAYRVVRREGGATPLVAAPIPRRRGARVMAIGRAGGRVKPSSGYAWTRILDDSAAITRSLARHGHPFDVPETPRRYRTLDAVMLEMMAHRGDRMARVFTEMFRRNRASRIFRFLDERSSALELALLVGSMPIGWATWAAARLALSRVRLALRG